MCMTIPLHLPGEFRAEKPCFKPPVTPKWFVGVVCIDRLQSTWWMPLLPDPMSCIVNPIQRLVVLALQRQMEASWSTTGNFDLIGFDVRFGKVSPNVCGVHRDVEIEHVGKCAQFSTRSKLGWEASFDHVEVKVVQPPLLLADVSRAARHLTDPGL